MTAPGSRSSTLGRRLARLEEASGAAQQARHDARLDAALRLLSDEDLTGLVEWLHRPETRQEAECPPHLAAAWQNAWERAGGSLPPQ